MLKSWAIPKGPSLDPADKRLAMQTEDHPIEYGDFEGVIPADEYGGGTVVVWDLGTWEPLGDAHQGFHGGSLKFRLHGRKLRGAFALIRIAAREARDAGKSWLLVKEKDAEARPGYDVVEAEPVSAISRRSLEEVAEARDRVWHSNRDEQVPARSVSRTAVAARTARPRSSGAKTDERAALDPGRLPGARKGTLPDSVQPQLATLVAQAPEGSDWLHEMKIDGYRVIARVEREVRLLTRHGNDWTERLPEVARAVAALGVRQALLDGEVAVVANDGTTSFQALQGWLGDGARQGSLVYFVFDLLHLDGHDLRAVPLHSRKEQLRSLLSGAGEGEAALLRFCEHVEGSGRELHAEACRLGLEGIVSKRRDGLYAAGRSRDWLKTKCLRAQELVIGGYTPPEGARVGIGALLIGFHDPSGHLRYAGKVGTGFTRVTLGWLEKRLAAIERASSPFADRVAGAARAHWVDPTLVAQVAFSEWTKDGRLRQPSFRGLREDKPAREVVRELPADDGAREHDASAAPSPARPSPNKPGNRAGPERRATRSGTPMSKPGARKRDEAAGEIEGVRLTHPDRVLVPEPATTKRDLARFYLAVAPRLLPHLRGRPTMLVRCPDGIEGECFYQKHAGFSAPDSLQRVRIQEARKTGDYLVVNDRAGLVGLAQIGILEVHAWNSRFEHLEQPDRLVFDLDPDTAVSWGRVRAAARRVRARLLELDLESFVKTTGGKGLHVVVPLQRAAGWDETARFAESVARDLAREEPEHYVAEMSKARRQGRIFIDWLRNHRGATSVTPYSPRARAGAPVSMPLAWEELDDVAGPEAFTIANTPQRLQQLDPWSGYAKVRQRLTASRLEAAGVA